MDEDLRKLERAAALSIQDRAAYGVGLARAGRDSAALWIGATSGPPLCSLVWLPRYTARLGQPGCAELLPGDPGPNLNGRIYPLTPPIPAPIAMVLTSAGHTSASAGVVVEMAWVYESPKDPPMGWINGTEFRCRQTGRLLKTRAFEPMLLSSSFTFRLTWSVRNEPRDPTRL